MLYNTNAIKQTQQGYEQAVTNSINQEQSTGDCNTVQIEQQLSVRNKNIKVILEFPTVVNEKAEEEFKDFLKGLYLKKLEIGSMQRDPQALKSPPIGRNPMKRSVTKKAMIEKSAMENSTDTSSYNTDRAYENNTKEGNSHE